MISARNSLWCSGTGHVTLGFRIEDKEVTFHHMAESSLYTMMSQNFQAQNNRGV